MKDPIVEYLKSKGIPVTRENYITLDTLGDHDGEGMLDAEQESELPEELKLEKEKE